MPDRRSLAVIGLVYCGITATVMLVACVIVSWHIAGRLSMDQATIARPAPEAR